MIETNGPVVALTDENFTHEVEHAEGLVLVDFYADWCGPCHMVSPILDRIAREHAGQVKVSKVDIDRFPALASRYGVRNLPTVLYIRDGEVLDAVVGAQSRGAFEEKVARHAGPTGSGA